MYFFSSACVALLAIRLTRAGLSPSEPSPGTVWTHGQEGTIQWSEDDSAPSIDNEWSHFTIGKQEVCHVMWRMNTTRY